MIPSGSAYLISWLRFGKSPLPDKYRARAHAALLEIQSNVDEQTAPATAEQILDIVEGLASMLQVDLPDERGLELYVLTLMDIPAGLLKQAAVHVARNHKWRTMPTPAEFREPIKHDAYAYAWLRRRLPEWIAMVE